MWVGSWVFLPTGENCNSSTKLSQTFNFTFTFTSMLIYTTVYFIDIGNSCNTGHVHAWCNFNQVILMCRTTQRTLQREGWGHGFWSWCCVVLLHGTDGVVPERGAQTGHWRLRRIGGGEWENVTITLSCMVLWGFHGENERTLLSLPHAWYCGVSSSPPTHYPDSLQTVQWQIETAVQTSSTFPSVSWKKPQWYSRTHTTLALSVSHTLLTHYSGTGSITHTTHTLLWHWYSITHTTRTLLWHCQYHTH